MTFTIVNIFQEFVLATNLSTCPSAKDKLRWAFKLYDKDESGSVSLEILRKVYMLYFAIKIGAIDLEELLEVVKTFYSMEGVPKVCLI